MNLENNEHLHRDKAATQQAGELMAGGYYGYNYQFCSAYIFLLNGEESPVFWKDEDSAVREILKYLAKGAIVTPLLYKSWCQSSEDDEQAMMAISRAVYEEHWVDWLRACYRQKLYSTVDCYQFLLNEKELKQITPCLTAQILQYAFFLGKITMQQFHDLRLCYQLDDSSENKDIDNPKNMAGLAWCEMNGRWTFYRDAYLPNVYRKRNELIKSGCVVSPIVVKKYQSQQERMAFSDLLTEELSYSVRTICQKITEYPCCIPDETIGSIDEKKPSSSEDGSEIISFFLAIRKAGKQA